MSPARRFHYRLGGSYHLPKLGLIPRLVTLHRFLFPPLRVCQKSQNVASLRRNRYHVSHSFFRELSLKCTSKQECSQVAVTMLLRQILPLNRDLARNITHFSAKSPLFNEIWRKIKLKSLHIRFITTNFAVS